MGKDFFIRFFQTTYAKSAATVLLLVLFLYSSYSVCFLSAKTKFALDQSLITAISNKYGDSARQNLLEWQQLIIDSSDDSDQEMLEKTNQFLNRFEFVSDEVHWHVNDYWATPIEFLATGGGDCEDFALAKYFTLKAMGMSEEKLNMTYVKSITLNQAHMVLTYYKTPAAEPLVLDNLINTIERASKRKDLLPIYSFNGSSLWIAKERGHGQRVGNSDNLKRWQELLQRMPSSLKQ